MKNRFAPLYRVRAILHSLFIFLYLYEVSNQLFTLAWEHIDDWNLYHGVASWLQAH